MVDAFLGVARASGTPWFLWRAIEPFIATLFDVSSPDSLNRVITLVSPHVLWGLWESDKDVITQLEFTKDAITRWAVAAPAVPYTEEVDVGVVAALLRIASASHLRPYIPVGIWAWLKKGSSLPRTDSYKYLLFGAEVEVLRYV